MALTYSFKALRHHIGRIQGGDLFPSDAEIFAGRTVAEICDGIAHSCPSLFKLEQDELQSWLRSAGLRHDRARNMDGMLVYLIGSTPFFFHLQQSARLKNLELAKKVAAAREGVEDSWLRLINPTLVTGLTEVEEAIKWATPKAPKAAATDRLALGLINFYLSCGGVIGFSHKDRTTYEGPFAKFLATAWQLLPRCIFAASDQTFIHYVRKRQTRKVKTSALLVEAQNIEVGVLDAYKRYQEKMGVEFFPPDANFSNHRTSAHSGHPRLAKRYEVTDACSDGSDSQP